GAAAGLCVGAGFGGGLREEGIDTRIEVVAAVGAAWRKAGGGVHVAEDVGVLVGADPFEDVHLERAVRDVGVEGAELRRADGERDSCGAKLLLQGDGEQAGLLVGGDLEVELKANAVRVWVKAGGVEQCAGAGGIVRVLREVGGRGGGPGAGRKQRALRELGVTAVERGDDGGAVDCERDGLSDAAVGEGGVGDVEVDVPDGRAGDLGDFYRGRVAQRVDHVRCEDVGGGVGGAFLKFERGGDGVRHDVELETGVGG